MIDGNSFRSELLLRTAWDLSNLVICGVLTLLWTWRGYIYLSVIQHKYFKVKMMFQSPISTFNERKGHHVPSFRNMSTVASVGAVKEGLKVLVIASPRAKKMVGIWLFGSAAWVFSIVVPGGVARLTRSGLSMTDWKFSGSVPPLSDEEWQQEFEKYKQSPE